MRSRQLQPGPVIIVPNVVPRLQRWLFQAALVNTLLEVDLTDADITCREFSYP